MSAYSVFAAGSLLIGTPDFLLFKQLPSQGTGTFEVYHSWMWVPVVQEDGSIGGLWNATIETTKKVLAERRLATVREMGERTCEFRSHASSPSVQQPAYMHSCRANDAGVQ